MKDEKRLNKKKVHNLITINNNSGFSKLLGCKIIELSYGYAKSKLKIDAKHLNWLKTVHGGVIWSLADHTAGALGSTLNRGAVSLQTTFNFLAMVKLGQTIISEARLINETSKTVMIEMKVSLENGKIIGLGTVTGIKL